MVRVILEHADYCDVPADLMTFDEGVVVFWREGEEVGRHRLERITSLEVHGSMGRRIEHARKTFPNAYRSWTPEEEEKLATLFSQGLDRDALIKELGRQPGGIEARLRTLGLLTDEEKFR